MAVVSLIDYESKLMAAQSAAGYSFPPGVDPRKEESIPAWIASFGSEAMTEGKYDEMLVEQGYGSLA